MTSSSNQEKQENKAYSPKEVESKWAKHWFDEKLFAVQIHPESKKNPETKPFSIALPPPNVTGELHMGHALSGTIQDVLIRYNRMKGKDVLWQIGTDHAGIGTQIVVEKFLKKNEKITRLDLGREKFVERTKAWKDEYGNKILSQMRVLGFSPDWDRCRYTMDDHYSVAVKDAFKKYFEDKLIYRGKRITNWCPKCKTSLSDLEIEKEDIKGKLYHIKYPVKNENWDEASKSTDLNNPKNYIVVATTRPETMFGDTGVAVNPTDERYKDLVAKGIQINLPFANREIPIVADDHVKVEFGTGAVKVTPAHDPNDFEIAARHDLPRIITMDDDTKLLPLDFIPSELHGIERYKARELAFEMLEEGGYIEKTSEYDKEKDAHDRCHTEIEPYLTNQWYVAMDKLAKTALDTVGSQRSKFIPERYETIFKNWLENIRDWCVSRQIWWGHRIPIFYFSYEKDGKDHLSWFAYAEDPHDVEKIISESSSSSAIRGDENKDEKLEKLKGIVALYDFERNLAEGISDLQGIESFESSSLEEFTKLANAGSVKVLWQDEDVLDTWFSSALWPFETMKSSNGSDETPEVFEHFYPSDVLATAREIINLWVSRMIYSSEYFEGTQPFTDILIHPVVQTPDGKRMSKSKGNAIDPLDMVDLYGADASRMWYASVGIYGSQDVKFPGKYDKSKKQWSSDTLEQYKRFANKLFNASKFVMMSLDNDEGNNGSKFQPKPISTLDKSKLTIADSWILDKFHSMLAEIEKRNIYDIGYLANSVYEFLWFNFCDWYIEFTKNKLTEENKQILFHILEASLRVLHPVMPFITEEIWQIIKDKYDLNAIDDEILNKNLDDKYKSSVCFAKFPQSIKEFISSETSPIDHIIDIVSSVRNSRQTLGISWSNEIKVHLNTDNSEEEKNIRAGEQYIKDFTKASEVVINAEEAAKPSTATLIGETKISIPLSGIVDLDKVQNSTQKKIDNLDKDINGLESRLKSEKFVQNAPKEKVDEVRDQLEELLKKKGIYKSELENLACAN